MKFAVMLAAAALVATGSALAQESDCQVTMGQYHQLREGMSLAQALAILGCEGVELSSSYIADIETVMYMWSGTGFGANMNAMFQNGRLVSKAQFGLK